MMTTLSFGMKKSPTPIFRTLIEEQAFSNAVRATLAWLCELQHSHVPARASGERSLLARCEIWAQYCYSERLPDLPLPILHLPLAALRSERENVAAPRMPRRG